MGNKYVYIAKKADRCDASDYRFFDSAQLLWEEYNELAGDGYRELTQKEFMESVENEELIEEFNSEFYRDVVVS